MFVCACVCVLDWPDLQVIVEMRPEEQNKLIERDGCSD